MRVKRISFDRANYANDDPPDGEAPDSGPFPYRRLPPVGRRRRVPGVGIAPRHSGARGASLAVGEDGSARLELDCASVRVAGSLPVHPDGGFSWKGTLTAEGPGPTRSDAAGKPVDLRGKIEGDAMTLTIQAAGTDAPIGTFSLERGRPGRLRKCS